MSQDKSAPLRGWAVIVCFWVRILFCFYLRKIRLLVAILVLRTFLMLSMFTFFSQGGGLSGGGLSGGELSGGGLSMYFFVLLSLLLGC